MSTNTHWTPTEVATLRQQAAAGTTTGEIARKLGRSRGAVRRMAQRQHIALTGKMDGPIATSRASERDAIAAELRAGRSMLSITKARRIDKAFVARIRDDLGMVGRPIDQPGVRDQVTALLRAGQTIRELHRRFGVSRPTLTEIRDELGIPVVQAHTRRVVKVKPPKPPRAVKPKVVRVVAPKPKPVPERVVVQPAPVEVRGTPGVWGIPVGRTLEQIEAIASGMGFSYGGLHDLPAFNKHRVNRHGLPPLAVNFTRGADFALPGILRSRII